MKIGIEARGLFREKKYSKEVSILETLKTLQTIDSRNEYVVFVRPDMDNACIQESANLKVVEVKGGADFFWDQVALPRAVMREKCDILHCTWGMGPARARIPLILSVDREDIYRWRAMGAKGYFANFYRKWAFPKGLSKAKKIITSSADEQKAIEKTFPHTKPRVSQVPFGLDPEFANTPTKNELNQIKEKYALPQRFLLVPACPAVKENMTTLLKGYALYSRKSKPLPLVILDYSNNEVERHLSKGKESRSYMKDILTLPYIARQDLPAILRLSEMLLYPVKWAGFPGPVLEAMACETPVLTASTGFMTSLTDNAAYTTDSRSHKEISLGIIRLITKKNLRSAIIQKGSKVAGNFTWLKTANKLLEIYQQQKP